MRVAVEEEHGIPAVENVYQPAHLGRLELHPVPVEIEVLPVVSLTHPLGGSDLVGAVGLADPLVAVRIEEGCDQDFDGCPEG